MKIISGGSENPQGVLEWDGTSWNQLGQDIDGEGAGDQSGYSVSLSSDGNIVAIGTPEEVASIKSSYTGLFLKEILKKAKCLMAHQSPVGKI